MSCLLWTVRTNPENNIYLGHSLVVFRKLYRNDNLILLVSLAFIDFLYAIEQFPYLIILMAGHKPDSEHFNFYFPIEISETLSCVETCENALPNIQKLKGE